MNELLSCLRLLIVINEKGITSVGTWSWNSNIRNVFKVSYFKSYIITLHNIKIKILKKYIFKFSLELSFLKLNNKFETCCITKLCFKPKTGRVVFYCIFKFLGAPGTKSQPFKHLCPIQRTKVCIEKESVITGDKNEDSSLRRKQPPTEKLYFRPELYAAMSDAFKHFIFHG